MTSYGLGFISYASTEMPLELMSRITWLFAYCFLWYNDMELCQLLPQGLGSFQFEKNYKTRQNSYAQLYQYPFQIHTYEIQTHSYLMHCGLPWVGCLQRNLDWFIFLGSFMYTSIKSNPWNVVAKQCYTPPEKKGKDEQHSCLEKTKKEREKGEVCSAIHETTMDCILIYHLHLTHEMNI